MFFRNAIAAIAVSILSAGIPLVAAAASTTMTLSTAQQKFTVEVSSSPGTSSRPVVVILSGAKGYKAAAYHRLSEDLNSAGIDVALIHYLSEQDESVIANATSGKARIAYYSRRMPDWIDAVGLTVTAIRTEPKYQSKVGILGISLGSMPATAATANNRGISASVIIDGGLPAGFATNLHWMPPLLMVWGADDLVFPQSSAIALKDRIGLLGGSVELQIFPKQKHGFFLEDQNKYADKARIDVVNFFSRHLK